MEHTHNIAPIDNKMGNPINTSNNKCVTLTYTVAKIYSHVLNNMFFKWSKKHETLTPNPFGFQRNASTINNNITSLAKI